MKTSRVAVILVFDVIFVNLAFFGAFLLYTELRASDLNLGYFLQLSIPMTFLKILIYYFCSLYRSIWEYASVEELVRVVFAVTLSNFISAGYILVLQQEIYFGILIATFAFDNLFIGANRFVYRILRRVKYQKSILYKVDTNRILLVGSGSTAGLIASEIKTHSGRYGRLVGFIDDDKSKIGHLIGGVKVLGDRNDIECIAERFRIDEIILAIPTATNQDTKQILEKCKLTNSKVTIVPGIVEIIGGEISIEKARPVKVEDLLGRDVVELDVRGIAHYIENKTVLITGGGGSIGSEICRQIIYLKPSKIVILDIYENTAYELQYELSAKADKGIELEVLIASVRERDTILDIVEKHKPDVIFHAAAHKHVPLMEVSPKEAVKNNVFGTLNVAEAAHKFGVKYFVQISSDKAVNPTSIMGASKRLCEMIVQSLAKISETKFVAVRFGNVLGSHASVIPLFEWQIKEGGPVTVTHKDVVRYFMTITEAARLVIQAGAIAKGGEVFILDMGEPVNIYNLAIDLIRLSGLKPYEDIDIVFTGLRPGEKLFEELLLADEGITRTSYNKIYIAAPQNINFIELKNRLVILGEKIKECTNDDVRVLLHDLVPTYRLSKNGNDREAVFSHAETTELYYG